MKKDTPTYPCGYNIPLFQPVTSKLCEPGWYSSLHKGAFFGDVRRQNCFTWLSGLLSTCRATVINQITNNESQRKRAERFLNNDFVEVSEVIEHCCVDVDAPQLALPSVYNYIDQCSINFSSAVGRIPGGAEELGSIGNGRQYGQKVVTGIFVSPQTDLPIGLSSLSFFSTPYHATPNSIRRNFEKDGRPLHWREPHKWSVAIEQAALRCTSTQEVVHVIDREGDNLNLLLSLWQSGNIFSTTSPARARQHLVIRANSNRKILLESTKGDSKSLKVKAAFNQSPVLGHVRLKIRHDERLVHAMRYENNGAKRHRLNERKVLSQGRTARLAVKSIEGRLDLNNLADQKRDMPKDQLEQLVQSTTLADQQLSFVTIYEVDEQGLPLVPETMQQKDITPVSWTILTTLPAQSLDEALRVIQIYRRRFPVCEELFRSLKADGMKIESAQFKSTKTLQIITAMALKESLTVQTMVNARDRMEGFEIQHFFYDDQIEVLKACAIKYLGPHALTKNPFPNEQLSWAVWIIAQLGGWKPANKQRPPGPKIIHRGLIRFETLCQGFNLFKFSRGDDVSQP